MESINDPYNIISKIQTFLPIYKEGEKTIIDTTFEKYLKNESYILVKPKLPDPELCSYVKTKLLKLLIIYFQKLQNSQTNLDDNKQLQLLTRIRDGGE